MASAADVEPVDFLPASRPESFARSNVWAKPLLSSPDTVSLFHQPFVFLSEKHTRV